MLSFLYVWLNANGKKIHIKFENTTQENALAKILVTLVETRTKMEQYFKYKLLE